MTARPHGRSAAHRTPTMALACGRGALAGLVCAALGCGDSALPHTGEARSRVIYGEDTRRDVYAVDNPSWARLALHGSVAFVSAEHLSGGDAAFDVVAPTLGASNNLCEGEAFAMQPAAATCSGVLVDDQLVLTAGHCLGEDGTCPQELLVFGYAMTDPASKPAVHGDSLYRCKSVPWRGRGIDREGVRWDHGFIELDRPVGAPMRPVEISRQQPTEGSGLTVIGYPGGLPVKIDSGVALLRAQPCLGYFTLDSDTFQASSGSGVFDDDGRLAGIFARGGVDYEYDATRGCAVSRRVAVANPAVAEQAGYIGAAIAALCATGWPSERLCGARPALAAAAPCLPADPVAASSDGCAVTGRARGGAARMLGVAMAALGLASRRARRGRITNGRG